MTSKGVLLLLSASVAVVLTVAWTASGESEDPDGRETAVVRDCPAADAVFREAGLPVPDTYGPGCPDVDQLRTDLAEATVGGAEVRAAEAIRDALESGVIHEVQNPSTYPTYLQKYVD
jgi:hypothetical protein